MIYNSIFLSFFDLKINMESLSDSAFEKRKHICIRESLSFVCLLKKKKNNNNHCDCEPKCEDVGTNSKG